MFFVSFVLFSIYHKKIPQKRFEKFLVTSCIAAGLEQLGFLESGCESFERRWFSLVLCLCISGSAWTSPLFDLKLGHCGVQVLYSLLNILKIVSV